MQNVLEAAGFSRTNPYNIVQQGKIAQMAKLSDEERLNLLKEVGGASLYEAKRKESQQTLESQKAQVEEIDTTVWSACTLPTPHTFLRVFRAVRLILNDSSSANSPTSC